MDIGAEYGKRDKSVDKWYILYSGKTKIQALKNKLKAIGNDFKIWNPLCKVSSLKKSGVSVSYAPAFQGYVFLSFNQPSESKLTEIKLKEDFPWIHFLRVGNECSYITSAEAESIENTVDGFNEKNVSIKGYAVGESIMINSGPFYGFVGKIISRKSNGFIIEIVSDGSRRITLEIGLKNVHYLS